ncbi:hypothetical protein H9L39_18070 [Fusarium oxysporum f. sp. albedinis]|nr:hypothetical protein H9L39_18070 [Fusarium oxysporum f. sp. albedinis]
MSEPAYVVMPVQADDTQHSEPDTAKKETEHRANTCDITAHQDSLYKYISWEDRIRTLGSFIGALSILFGAHYLPITQLALKAGAVTFGVMSVTEFASQSFGPNTFLSRLRPKEYKKIPETTLNATLKDIHDFVQYAVVQIQRIIFAQDLDRTFAAFLGLTTMYWLIKAIPPFGLAVLGLTSIYVAPLITSPRGREVAHDGMVRAEELTNAAAEKGNTLVQGGKAKAADLSSKAQETAGGMRRHIGDLTQSGAQTVADLPSQARNTASDVSGATAEKLRRLPEKATNVINKAPGIIKSASSDAEQQ